MERILKRKELVNELASRTGFFKHNIDELLNALDDVIVENMSTATKSEPSEIRLSLGFTFGGRYSPRRQVRNPKTGEMVVTPAKYIPYARFSPAFRKKINKK